MKCSHGLDFEVKCSKCFDDAMKLVDFKIHDFGSRGKTSQDMDFTLGGIPLGIEHNVQSDKD